MEGLQEALQQIAYERSHLHSQLIELDSALSEVAQNKETYKLIGNILVKAEPATLLKDLQEKKKVIETRIDALKKQEDQIKGMKK